MTTLGGTILLKRALVMEVTEDPNVTPRFVVAGSVGSVSAGGSAMMGKVDTLTQDGAFRSYGNGNTRLILGASKSRTNTFALRAVSDADVKVLDALLGHLVIYCDTYGRRVIGAFLSMDKMNIPLTQGMTDVSLTLQAVTYDEAV